jgi:hypothetical protein
MRWLSILVLAVALVAAGCGGDDDSSSASDDTTIEETLTEETTTDEETTTEETTDETTDLSGVLEDEDCLALASAGSAFAQAFSGTGTSEDAEAFQELADSVPDEIKADVQVLAEAFATYSEELQDIGLEAGATPTAEQLQQLQAALASIDQTEVTAASERLGTWAEENCTSG